MRRNRRLLSVLLCIVVALLGSSLVALPAQASSAYDDVIHPVSSLRLKKNNSNLVNITTSYGYDIYNADATAYGHFHDCIVSSTCKYALLQEVDNAAMSYYRHQGAVVFVYAMDGVGSIDFDGSGPYGSPEAVLSRPSGGFGYISIYLKDDWSSTDRVVWETTTGSIQVAKMQPKSGACENNWNPITGNYCGITNDLGDQGIQPFLSTFPVNYPSGYEGEEIPTQAAHAKYVAMGDSFSSGEGNPPFEAGTDYGNINECHRSSEAYPRLLEANTSLALGSTAFVACSGATTTSVTSGNSGTGNWDEGPQIDALSDDTEVVTITIGGNDAGFKEYLEGCIVAPCGSETMTYNAILDLIHSSSFSTNLQYTYEQILDSAENADVYVVDYPFITAVDASYCGIIDLSGGRAIQLALNSAIELAVEDVQSESVDYSNRLKYVDTNASGSPFVGKHYCNGGDTDFNGASFPLAYSFHPNMDGHIDFASIVSNEIG